MSELLIGFQDLKSILNKRVTTHVIPEINRGIAQTLAVHNVMTDQMRNLFTTVTTEHKVRYRTQPGHRLQPLDEWGRAQKVHGAGSYDVAFPLLSAGSAFGYTRLARLKQTVQDVNDDLAMMLDADKTFQRDLILSAIFTNVNYTYRDRQYGDLTIKPLANSDGTIYLTRPGFEDGEQFNSYRTVSALAVGTFETIYTDLTNRPENAGNGKVITFVNSAQTATVRALSDFIEVEDPDIKQGVNTAVLTGSLDASVPGRVLGKTGRNWVVEWDAIPASYTVSIITSGDRPLAVREHPEPELRGFSAVAEREDHPYLERQFERHMGVGAWNRVGAIVYKITGGSYDIPSGYDARIVW